MYAEPCCMAYAAMSVTAERSDSAARHGLSPWSTNVLGELANSSLLGSSDSSVEATHVPLHVSSLDSSS